MCLCRKLIHILGTQPRETNSTCLEWFNAGVSHGFIIPVRSPFPTGFAAHEPTCRVHRVTRVPALTTPSAEVPEFVRSLAVPSWATRPPESPRRGVQNTTKHAGLGHWSQIWEVGPGIKHWEKQSTNDRVSCVGLQYDFV